MGGTFKCSAIAWYRASILGSYAPGEVVRMDANITRALGKTSDAGILKVKDLKNSINPTTGYELFKIISKAGASNLDHNKESKVEV